MVDACRDRDSFRAARDEYWPPRDGPRLPWPRPAHQDRRAGRQLATAGHRAQPLPGAHPAGSQRAAGARSPGFTPCDAHSQLG